MEKSINKKEQCVQTDVKCRFFAQYWGQPVQRYENNDYIKVVNGFIETSLQDKDYLLLKPLSKITNEEAIEVAKIYQSNIRGLSLLGIAGVSKQEILRAGLEFCKRIDGNYWNNFANVFQMLSAFDYLRSKGYALPFMGYSVEDLVSFGWVQLV